MVLDRHDGAVTIGPFARLLECLRSGDLLVVNDTRVSARRHVVRLPSGRSGEVLLLRPAGDREWEALVYPGKNMRAGVEIVFGTRCCDEVRAIVTDRTPDGGRVLRFADAAARDSMAASGEAPLPPYIRERLADEERYQTVYGTHPGSAAAPTAGLHFTEEMLTAAQNLGVQVARLTLHVGVDTFRPVREDDVDRHVMHGEWYSIGQAASEAIAACRGRIVAVGTTVVRALESAARDEGAVTAGSGVTRLFIRPGHQFRVVEALLTNFHLPRSTLLMLVSAFAGREAVLAAYRRAVAEQMRFYSFGDAMLVIASEGRRRS
jgi:S-adenosylmethionine:tRNA ribosyltransferase-isomerase